MKKNTNSMISILSFAKETINYFTNPNQLWISWGNDNKTPFNILELYDNVPEHSATIDFIETLVTGDGISNEKIDYWTLKKIVLDNILFGGYCLQVLTTRGGGYELGYVDISKCRLSKDKKQVLYSEEWGKTRPNIEYYNVSNDTKTDGIYFFVNNKTRSDYPRPYYISANTSLLTMRHIIEYHNTIASSGFSPNVVINFNNGESDPDTKSKIEKGIIDKFSGSNGQKFILSFNPSADNKTTIEKLDVDNLEEKYELLQKFIQNQIIVSHKLTSGCLIGIIPENQGFSEVEYQQSLNVFKEVVISGFRREFIYSIGKLIGEDVIFIDKNNNNINGTINITPNS